MVEETRAHLPLAEAGAEASREEVRRLAFELALPPLVLLEDGDWTCAVIQVDDVGVEEKAVAHSALVSQPVTASAFAGRHGG